MKVERTTVSSPPKPGKGDDEAQTPQFVDPKTGKPAKIADMRAEFERLSRQAPRDPEAERAFIKGRIEMIRSDPHLCAQEKEDAIRELQRLAG